jgi:hypothetical protein
MHAWFAGVWPSLFAATICVLRIGKWKWTTGLRRSRLYDEEMHMTPELRRRVATVAGGNELPSIVPLTAVTQLDHLLKVAGSISQDANQTWAEIWGELKRLTTGGGLVVREAEKGFVPECGWPEFLEKFWLLKHYLDSIQRICDKQ